MASLAIRKQVMAVAMCEGFVEMMWTQRYSLQENNQIFAGIRDRLQRDATTAYAAIGSCGQRLSFEEWEDLKRNKVERFKALAFHEGFAAMDAVGLMVDLVTEQLSFCRQGSSKHAAFDNIHWPGGNEADPMEIKKNKLNWACRGGAGTVTRLVVTARSISGCRMPWATALTKSIIFA